MCPGGSLCSSLGSWAHCCQHAVPTNESSTRKLSPTPGPYVNSASLTPPPRLLEEIVVSGATSPRLPNKNLGPCRHHSLTSHARSTQLGSPCAVEPSSRQGPQMPTEVTLCRLHSLLEGPVSSRLFYRKHLKFNSLVYWPSDFCRLPVKGQVEMP